MQTILISGANRGIGLELARQFSAGGWSVIGTARDVDDAAELRDLGAEVHPLDVTRPLSVKALADSLKGRPIDVLMANAGVSGDVKANAFEVDKADFLQVQAVNTFGPLTLAAALRTNIELGQRKLVTAMSSLMSSISANDWGTQYSYRASKTGLNAAWSGLAREWKPLGLSCVLLRPGFVATRMTDYQGLKVEDSVAGLKKVIEGLTLDDAGRIIGYDGIDVPW